MTSPRRTLLGWSTTFIFIVAACGTGGSPATPSSQPSAAASSAASPGPSSVPQAGQSDTDWGLIWDSLPSGFPIYPGATPDEEAAGGPASAVLVVEGLDAKDVATFYQTQLVKAGYMTIGSAEPLEDGGYVLDMTGAPEGCMLQVTVKPTGGVTMATILYGAACPSG